MKTGFITLILFIFSFSTLSRSLAFEGLQNLVKIEVTHSHEDENHHSLDHSHESDHDDHHKTASHDSEPHDNQHTHTHEILVLVGQYWAVLTKETLLTFEFVANQFPQALNEGHLLDRPFDSIFRPPIYV